MKKFIVVELHGNSDMPNDWTFDGQRFRFLFNRDHAALFDSEAEALAAVANVPRRPNSLLTTFAR